MEKKIKVLIVDDSSIFRGLWSQRLGNEEDIEVIATASNGKIAIEKVCSLPVDVVLLDIEMPVMDGLEALPILLEKNSSLKIFIVSSISQATANTSIKALELGAIDVVPKPTGSSPSQSIEKIATDLLSKIRNTLKKEISKNKISSFSLENSTIKKPNCIVIGSSTGGPKALTDVLNQLPINLDIPILIVQHISESFVNQLALSIQNIAKRECIVPTESICLESRKIYLAPHDLHMVLKNEMDKIVINLTKDKMENYCRPSVNPLFASAAEIYKDKLLAIILTGMGEDGLRGSEEVRKNHGIVIAQDESTSVVWGMPGAVAKANLANYILPISNIHDIIQTIQPLKKSA